MRRALIIGAAGQDGQLLARSLMTGGCQVVGVTRTPPPASLPFKTVSDTGLGSVESAKDLLQSIQPDEIYYLAAFHHSAEDKVELSTAELLRRSFEVHVDGLICFLEGMKALASRARLFYAASSHVFGQPASEWQDEQTPFAPTNPYGISKAAGVQCCRYYRQSERVYAATGILYNHESPLRKPSFLSQKIVLGAQRARRDPAFRLALGNLDARIDWGYAPDYVEAMSRILQLPEADDFVVASGETHSVREFAEAAFGAVDLDWRDHVETDPALLKKSFHLLRGDASKLRAATGWEPRMNFREMVATLVRDTKSTPYE